METPGDETPGQRAARLRREKRANKALGEERLAKIKQLNGGIAPPEEALGGPVAAHVSDAVDDDPAEGDISATQYGSNASRASAAQRPFDDPMMQAIAQMQAQQARQGPQQPPQSVQGADVGGGAEDPMAKMMQQLMGMAGGDPNDPNNVHNTEDPMKMLSALMGGQQAQDQPQASKSSTYLWRVTHALFAIMIAGYIAVTSTFDGSLLARTQSTYQDGESGHLGHRLFLIFVTAELALQSTRFFLEGGRLQGSGMLASISQIAPEPWASYVRAAGRWISIVGSIISDAMIVIFVLGVMAWWNGTTTA